MSFLKSYMTNDIEGVGKGSLVGPWLWPDNEGVIGPWGKGLPSLCDGRVAGGPRGDWVGNLELSRKIVEKSWRRPKWRDGGRAFLPRIRESYSGWFLLIEFWEKNKRIKKKKIIVKKKNSEEQFMWLGKRGKVISAWNRVCGVLWDSDQIELSLVSLEQWVSTRGGPPSPDIGNLSQLGGPGVVLLVPRGYRPGTLETYSAHNSLPQPRTVWSKCQ